MNAPLRLPCRDRRGAIDAVIDGALPSTVRDGLEAHAAGCTRCREALDEALSLRALLEAAPNVEPSKSVEDAFVNSVLNRIDEAERGSDRKPVPALRRRRNQLLSVTTIALSSAAALWLAWIPASPPASPPARPAASAAPLRHATTPTPRVAVLEESPPEERSTAQAAPPIARTVPEDVSPQRFREALAAALFFQPYQAAKDADSSRWSRLVEHDLGVARALRSARQRLREELAKQESSASGAAEARLAARLLGHRGDYQDRRLLIDSLAVIGEAGALALIERGPTGAAAIWKVATSVEPSRARTCARRCLTRLSRESELAWLTKLDLASDVPFAVGLIAASHEDAAEIFLHRYLDEEDGDAWLAALEERPFAGEALDRVLAGAIGAVGSEGGRRPRSLARGATRRRLLAALHRIHCEHGLAFTLQSLEAGEPEAARVLAQLPGLDPPYALVAGTGAGAFRAELEEEAWVRMGDERHVDLARLIPELDAHDQAAAVEALAVATEESLGAALALLGVGASDVVEAERRVLALLAAAEALESSEQARTLPSSAALGSETLRLLRAALQLSDERVAAAAALALHHLGEPLDELPESVLRALRRRGTLHVRHLRAARAFGRACPAPSSRSL